MLYQQKNGKTINMTIEQYLKMTDLDLKDLEGSNYGQVVNDPFLDSSLEDFRIFEDEFPLPDIEDVQLDEEEEE